MPRIVLLLVVLVATGGFAFSTPEEEASQWMKLDVALKVGEQTGRPICVFAMVDEKGESPWGSTTAEVDRALRDKANKAMLEDFSMVRCADVKTAKRIKAQNVPVFIFLDGDGVEIYRKSLRKEKAMKPAFEAALKKYPSAKVDWATGKIDAIREQAKKDKKILFLAFVDDKKESQTFLKSLQDRWIAKHHDRFLFVTQAWKKDSEVCKTWGVRLAPTMLVVDPTVEKESDSVLVRLAGKTRTKSLRRAVVQGIEKYQKAHNED